ncbi:hypothetical protein EJ08DRAFT_734300 [Tothia fuscella]|uniref:Uncharacterized protein n=1 Tax=Tothia fuscella TaxID=1048955 RepID=A0A9P4NRU7_9PEZI|nr:hypothetical protein EJ08DRAFT_734300 [Tothia fuscella]
MSSGMCGMGSQINRPGYSPRRKPESRSQSSRKTNKNRTGSNLQNQEIESARAKSPLREIDDFDRLRRMTPERVERIWERRAQGLEEFREDMNDEVLGSTDAKVVGL